jgi:hypothetical protein
MPQIGSNSNPMMMRQTIAGKGSRIRKGTNYARYKDNFDKIFNKDSDPECATEFEGARAISKTFSMEQD